MSVDLGSLLPVPFNNCIIYEFTNEKPYICLKYIPLEKNICTGYMTNMNE